MQALERKMEPLPAFPGKLGCYEYEYIRHDTASLITGFEIAADHVVAQVGSTRKADDLLEFMGKLA